MQRYWKDIEFLGSLHNAFLGVIISNLSPYLETDAFYYLNTVINAYCKLMNRHPDFKEDCEGIMDDLGKAIIIESNESDVMDRIFNYLNKEDLESLTNTSVGLRQAVAGFVRR